MESMLKSTYTTFVLIHICRQLSLSLPLCPSQTPGSMPNTILNSATLPTSFILTTCGSRVDNIFLRVVLGGHNYYDPLRILGRCCRTEGLNPLERMRKVICRQKLRPMIVTYLDLGRERWGKSHTSSYGRRGGHDKTTQQVLTWTTVAARDHFRWTNASPAEVCRQF